MHFDNLLKKKNMGNFFEGPLSINILNFEGYMWFGHTCFLALSNCKETNNKTKNHLAHLLTQQPHKNELQRPSDLQAGVAWSLIYGNSFKVHWKTQHQTEGQGLDGLKKASYSSSPKLFWY